MDTKELKKIREGLNERISFRVLDPTDKMQDLFLEQSLQKTLDEIDRLKAYEDIRCESEGVYGYHLNGDDSPWEEFGL